MERVLFGRVILGALALAGCTTSSAQEQFSELSPELAELVAQPQTGSFNPDARKDAEFFKDTPERFRPFVAVCNPWDEWDKPAPPFRIFGNSYYVGTCGISSILVTSNEGHVLIDSGTEAGADVVLANIRSLGFDLEDVELLLTSHEHFDHVGGMAKVQEATGGKVISSQTGIYVLVNGTDHPDDPQFGMHEPMQPITHGMPYNYANAPELLERYGLTPHPTPGHTPGALSWSWQSCEGEVCRTIAYADSLSPVSADNYRFSDHPDYLADYFAGLERLGSVPCDILIAAHPSHSRLLKRMRVGELVEPGACAYYAIGKVQDLEARLAKEAEQATSQ